MAAVICSPCIHCACVVMSELGLDAPEGLVGAGAEAPASDWPIGPRSRRRGSPPAAAA